MLKRLMIACLLILTLSAVSEAYGKGQSNDDCPPHSKDPDCATK